MTKLKTPSWRETEGIQKGLGGVPLPTMVLTTSKIAPQEDVIPKTTQNIEINKKEFISHKLISRHILIGKSHFGFPLLVTLFRPRIETKACLGEIFTE